MKPTAIENEKKWLEIYLSQIPLSTEVLLKMYRDIDRAFLRCYLEGKCRN